MRVWFNERIESNKFFLFRYQQKVQNPEEEIQHIGHKVIKQVHSGSASIVEWNEFFEGKLLSKY